MPTTDEQVTKAAIFACGMIGAAIALLAVLVGQDRLYRLCRSQTGRLDVIGEIERKQAATIAGVLDEVGARRRRHF